MLVAFFAYRYYQEAKIDAAWDKIYAPIGQ
jgi:hypothetical protein